MAKSLQELKADYVRQMAEGRAAEDRMIKQLDVNRTRVEQLKGAVFAIDQALAEQKAQADQDAAALKAAADAKAAADVAAANAAAAAAAAAAQLPQDASVASSSANGAQGNVVASGSDGTASDASQNNQQDNQGA